jgi:hypothetical protein
VYNTVAQQEAAEVYLDVSGFIHTRRDPVDKQIFNLLCLVFWVQRKCDQFCALSSIDRPWGDTSLSQALVNTSVVTFEER